MICWRKWKAKIVRSVMTLIISVGKNMKWMLKLTLCMVNLKKNTRDNIYIWIVETTDGAKDIVKGNNIIYFSDNGLERGLFRSKRRWT